MPVILSAPGTVEPLANVAVKPRVDGQIVEVAFSEGDMVEEGSVLFRLDDRMVKAQIAQAEANIAKDQASLRDAEATLARRQALIGKQVVTEAALDQARYAVEGLQGQHRRRPGPAGLAEDAARLSHHPRADHRPHGQPHRQAGRHRAVAGCRGPGHHQPDQADPGQLCRAAGRACRRAARARLQGDGRNRGAGRQARVGAGHDQLHRQPGRQADRLHRRQGGVRQRRRDCCGRACRWRWRSPSRSSRACCRCRPAPCCRRSRA